MTDRRREPELIALVRDDHAAVARLLAEAIDAADTDPARARAAMDEARVRLLAHLAATARALHPALAGRAALADGARAARGDDDVLDALVERLRGAPEVDACWRATARVLQTLVAHHVDDEEHELLPGLCAGADAAALDELAEALKEQLVRALRVLGDDVRAEAVRGRTLSLRDTVERPVVA